MEFGIDFSLTLQYLRSLRKNQNQFNKSFVERPEMLGSEEFPRDLGPYTGALECFLSGPHGLKIG